MSKDNKIIYIASFIKDLIETGNKDNNTLVEIVERHFKNITNELKCEIVNLSKQFQIGNLTEAELLIKLDQTI